MFQPLSVQIRDGRLQVDKQQTSHPPVDCQGDHLCNGWETSDGAVIRRVLLVTTLVDEQSQSKRKLNISTKLSQIKNKSVHFSLFLGWSIWEKIYLFHFQKGETVHFPLF